MGCDLAHRATLPAIFRTRRYRPIHAECAERTEQRPIEQGTPPRVQNSGVPARTRNEVLQPDIRLIGDASILARPADYLGLHP